MQTRNWIIGKNAEKRDFTSLACLLLLSMFTHAVARAAEQPAIPFGTQLNTPAHDTKAGTIQQLITSHAAGAPAGLELLVDGPQGSFTASLGPNLRPEVQKSLSQGAPVQISGTMQTIDGQQYLLARTLTIAGKQITIRNVNGVPVHTSKRSGASASNSALYRSAK